MKNKIFLSSMLIMSFAPAMAETFPSNGLMQENTTYTNAATETNMAGVYEGSVNATAEYTDILYNIAAGNYLPAGSEDTNGAQCTAGNFCTGLTDATYDSESDQGLTSCSTLGDGSYTLSPAGATNGNMCYKTCSASCTNPTAPAHSTNVSYGHETTSGTQYYGSQCDAVTPTCSINFDCVNGYHKRPDLTTAQGVILAKQMAQAQGQDITNVPDSYFAEQAEQAFANWEMLWSSLSAAEKGMFTQAIDSVQGHQQNSGSQQVSIWQPFIDLARESDFQSSNASSATNYHYEKGLTGDERCIVANGLGYSVTYDTLSCNTLSQQNSDFASFRQSAQNGDWMVVFPDKNISITGTTKCDAENEYMPNQHRFTSINGVSASSDWGGGDMPYFGTDCENYAVGDAAFSAIFEAVYAGLFNTYDANTVEQEFGVSGPNQIIYSIQVASNTITVSGSAPYIDYMCDANTININWLGADDEDISANNAGSAKYDGDIRTPVKAQTIKGKTFRGWRFSKPQTTTGNNG